MGLWAGGSAAARDPVGTAFTYYAVTADKLGNIAGYALDVSYNGTLVSLTNNYTGKTTLSCRANQSDGTAINAYADGVHGQSDTGDAALYVSKRDQTGFVVRAREGEPDVEFSYRLVARRRDFEHLRLGPAPWAEEGPNLYR